VWPRSLGGFQSQCCLSCLPCSRSSFYTEDDIELLTEDLCCSQNP
jgi:hypothetical protein